MEFYNGRKLECLRNGRRQKKSVWARFYIIEQIRKCVCVSRAMNIEVHTVPWLQRRRQYTTALREAGIVHRVEGLLYLPVMLCIWKSERCCSKTHVFLSGKSNIIYRERYRCLPYCFISWWWRIQLLSCSCMWRKCSEWMFFCPAASRSSLLPPQYCREGVNTQLR